jgi:Na+/H+ antiporter NhaC
MQKPSIIIANIPVKLSFVLKDQSNKQSRIDTSFTMRGVSIKSDRGIEKITTISIKQGLAVIDKAIFKDSGYHVITFPQLNANFNVRAIPGWFSLLPPLVAILLALIVRQVLVALFVGIWMGAFLIYDYNPLAGFLYGLTEYIAKAAAHPDKMAILVFSLVLGGMVGVISKMGGTQGIVNKISHYASDSRRGQLATWLMGIFIFFDDYANTLIVGNTMRPLTDKLKISREKLSYLVDSTAAPVANIAIISTWIGFEIGLIASSFESLGISDNAYIIFLKTIPYNYYPIFALVLGFFIAIFRRDFGPMLKAEQRAIKTGRVLAAGAKPISSLDTHDMLADEKIPKRWYNGLIPIAVVILTTLFGLWFTGLSQVDAMGIDTGTMHTVQYISTIIGQSDSYAVLMWAAFLGSFTAIILSLLQRILTLEQSLSAWVSGIKAMMMAVLILTLAWSIGNICTDLKTAEYVIHISEDYISAHYIPFLSFVIAALISFATGTSWGVMAILMPIMIPLAYLLPQSDASISLLQQQNIFLSTIASVLAGATFGDHCSPISDTTIMSSMASGADHIDHVRTQLPYALVCGVISIVIGYLPVGFAIDTFLLLPVGILAIFLIVRFMGKKITN